MIYREILEMETQPETFYDITKKIKPIVESCLIKEGLCNVFLTATTAGLMINENDKMLYEDMRRFFRSMAPDERLYSHPDNAKSHIKASLLSEQLTIPVINGRLELGQWQSILLWEFDVRNRERKIIVTIQGP